MSMPVRIEDELYEQAKAAAKGECRRHQPDQGRGAETERGGGESQGDSVRSGEWGVGIAEWGAVVFNPHSEIRNLKYL